MMSRYRFFEGLGGEIRYLMVDPGSDSLELTTEKEAASIFSDEDWQNWRDSTDFELEREEIPEDEYMRLLGEKLAPMLPGFE